MNTELREQLGQAVYAAQRQYLIEKEGYKNPPTWEECHEDIRELNRNRGEAAVSSFVSMIMPTAQQALNIIMPALSEEQKGHLIAVVEKIKASVLQEESK